MMPPATATTTTNAQPPSLSHLINMATRPEHTSLNALIISLLPFALPPHTSSPLLYARGISHILPIYETLEIAFRDLIAQVDSGIGRGNENQRRLARVLKGLWMPRLERAERLKGDIEIFRQRCSRGSDAEGKEDGVQWSPEVQSPALRSLTTHLRTTITNQPHLLLPSAWLLYMALFSGGRYIRARLLQAGPEFWNPTAPPSNATPKPTANHLKMTNEDMEAMGLSFWTFAGERDGEDIKAEFKRRFGEMDSILLGTEMAEIIREAYSFMESIDTIVREAVDIIDAAGKGSSSSRWDPEGRRARNKMGLARGHFYHWLIGGGWEREG